MTDTHYLQIQGRPFPEGQHWHEVVEGSVSERAQALADATGCNVNACLDFGGALFPDERVGDWGCFLPRRRPQARGAR
jgi:hypothetical protein